VFHGRTKFDPGNDWRLVTGDVGCGGWRTAHHTLTGTVRDATGNTGTTSITVILKN